MARERLKGSKSARMTSPITLDYKRNSILSLIAFFLDVAMTSVVPQDLSAERVALLILGFVSSFFVLLFRRKLGNGVVLVSVIAAFLLCAWVRGEISGPFWMLLLAWVFFASESKRYRSVVLYSILLLAAISSATLVTNTFENEFFVLNIFFLLGLAAAQSERFRIAYEREVIERQQQQQADQKAKAEQYVEESRAHIARELHDIVAHSVSVMVVQARGARQSAGLPRTVESSLKVIEESGRESLNDLRQMIKTLRPPNEVWAADSVVAPLPSFDTLEKLIEGVQKSGLDISYTLLGEYQQASKSIQLSVYRLVQESLTNVVRHAEATQVEVTIKVSPSTIALRIMDNGSGAKEKDLIEGYGLQGMKERVATCGGSITIGVVDSGGFEVSAQLPLGGEPTQQELGAEVG